MIFFWTLYHLLKIETIFGLSISSPLSDPTIVLKTYLSKRKETLQALPPVELIQKFAEISEFLIWALKTLSSNVGPSVKHTLVHLTAYRIVYIGWMLITTLETPQKDTPFTCIGNDITAKLHSHMPPLRAPSRTIAMFYQTKFQQLASPHTKSFLPSLMELISPLLLSDNSDPTLAKLQNPRGS